MKSRLVVICSEYPYLQNETFLINELTYLKNEFDEVVLLPLDTVRQFDFISEYTVLKIEQNEISIRDVFSAITTVSVLRELIVILFKFEKIILRCKIALNTWIQANRIARVLSKHKEHPNTVFYSYWGMDGAIALAILKKKHSNLKVASRFHGWDVFKTANEVNYLPFRSFIASTIPNLFPISNAGKSEIEKWHSSARPKVFYLGAENNGKILNQQSTELVVLSLSNFNLVKRMPLLFEVIGKIKIRVHWIHIGAGEGDRFIVQEGVQKIPKNVSFEWKGALSHQEVLDFFSSQSVSCLINLSSSEGIPVSMMEAMSFGIPVFATNVGGVSEIVDDTCGVLIDKNLDATDIAILLEQFLISDLTSYRSKAKEKWASRFDARNNFTSFTNHLKQLIE